MFSVEYLTSNQELINEVQFIIEEWNSEKSSYIVNTSGSTGSPKSISIPRQAMLNSAKMTIEYLDLQNNDTALLCLSPQTIGGRMMIIRALVGEYKLLVTDASRSPLSEIDQKIDFCAMVPLQVQSSMESGDISRVNKLIIGGGELQPQLAEQLRNLKTKVYQTFGMTETISHVAMKNISEGETAFQALPNITFSANDNQLIIDAPLLGVTQLITNDIVELHNTTSFTWKGRADFTINSGGIKLQPEVIEEKLRAIITLPYFIAGEKNKEFGEIVTLFIESLNPIEKLNKELLATVLGKYEIPKKIRYLSSFSYTESGKLNRIKTRENSVNAKERML